MTNDKKSNKFTKNKNIDLMSQKTEDESTTNEISVKHVREDLKQVIEQMGSHQTDTEDSTTFNESLVQLEIKEITHIGTKAIFDSSQDNSQMTAYDISEITECLCPQVDVQQMLDKNVQSTMDSYPSTYVANEKHPQEPNNPNIAKQEIPERSSRLANWLGGIKNKKENVCKCNKNCELYTINIEQPTDDHSPPRRLVFDLLDELPKPNTKTVATNTKKNKTLMFEKKSRGIHDHIIRNTKGEDGTQRVDIYYFDHGNSEYYRTTDSPPVIMTEILAERTEHYTKRFWAQVFGTIQIGVAFVVSFVLQFVRFLLQAIVRPLTIGLIQIVSDYFIKPCFAISFNGVIQPALIFFYNMAISMRDVSHPIADSIGYFIREFGILLKSIRLINVDNSKTIKTCSKAKEEETCAKP